MAKRATAEVEDQLAELLGQQHYQLLRDALEQIVAGEGQPHATGRVADERPR